MDDTGKGSGPGLDAEVACGWLGVMDLPVAVPEERCGHTQACAADNCNMVMHDAGAGWLGVNRCGPHGRALRVQQGVECALTSGSMLSFYCTGITLDNLYDWDQETNQLMEGGCAQHL